MEFVASRNFVVKKGPFWLLLKNTPFSGLDWQQAHVITDQGKIPSVEVEKLFFILGLGTSRKSDKGWNDLSLRRVSWRQGGGRQNQDRNFLNFLDWEKHCAFKPQKKKFYVNILPKEDNGWSRQWRVG